MSKARWIGVGVIVVPILLFALYLLLALNWSYSEGERAGILQKFQRKGWVCKTHEGELAMTTVAGVAPTLWNFTVSDDDLAGQLREHVGRRVVLHYEEHRGLPSSCFGETSYFVDSFKPQE